MDHKDVRQYILAGLFALIGLVLIGSVIWVLSREKGIAQAKISVQVFYRSIGGLTEGAPIRLSGVNIGSVGQIEFLGQNVLGRRVKVVMNIFQKYQDLIDSTAKFYIISEGVIGEKLVEIKVSGGGTPLDPDRPVIGEDPLEMQELAAAFAGAANTFQKTAEGFNQDFSQIDMKAMADVLMETSLALTHTSKEIDQLILDVRSTLKDTSGEVRPMLQEIRETNRRTKKILDRVEQKLIDGNLFKVF